MVKKEKKWEIQSLPRNQIFLFAQAANLRAGLHSRGEGRVK